MNDEEIKMFKRMMKSHDKLIKLVKCIDELPDEQRKKLEAINLCGPKHDKEMAGLISEYKEIKKQFEVEIEKQKSVYDGLTKEEMIARMTGKTESCPPKAK